MRLYPLYVTATFMVVIFFMLLSGAPALHLARTDASGRHVIRFPAAVVGVTLALSCVVYAAAWRVKRTAWFERYVANIPLVTEHEATADGAALKQHAGAATESEAELTSVVATDGVAEERAPLVAPPAAEAPEDAPAPAPQQHGGGGGMLSKLSSLALSGVSQDVVTPSSAAAVAAHELATRYDARTERLFSACQVFTASFASLAHGSNDVANAVAPLSVIASVWAHGGTHVASAARTPAWCLAYGGAFIDLGLLLMGYRVMRSLGNNITYHSPSRGFCMELGALTTVLWASATGAAVSTTHCITGATVGVGLCTGTMRGVNWRMVAWTTLGWLITLPAAGLVSGIVFALIARSPKALSAAEAHPGATWLAPPPPWLAPPPLPSG